MLFLADEDFPGIAVSWLRETGHDVLWARTSMPGQSDTSLLAAAQRESRIVLTCDKDFGELAFHWGLPATCGIVLFRLPQVSPKSFLERVMLLMASADDIGFVGAFCVVEAGRVRARLLSGVS
jgi:predicted nuclease of predicted toxin-antitoxin system